MVAFNHYQLLAPLSRACIPSWHSPSQFSVPVHSPYYSSISSLFRSPTEQGFRKTSFFLLPDAQNRERTFAAPTPLATNFLLGVARFPSGSPKISASFIKFISSSF
jgi:hypothetical protein